MDFKTSVSGNIVVQFTLSGILDTPASEKLRIEIERIKIYHPTILVFRAAELKAITSAGLRAIIFAKQKLDNIPFYLVKVQSAVYETLASVDLHNEFVIVSEYPIVY